MKIKIRISASKISATPINPSISVNRGHRIHSRGELGLPPSAGRRIRNAVEEIGTDGLFSTVFLPDCPTPELINRIRTHLKCQAVGVVEYGMQNGWHIHIVHELDRDSAAKILDNYGRSHHENIKDIRRSAWYLTKNIGIKPSGEHPISWYFCSRELGRDEVFYVDSTLKEIRLTGSWIILEFCIICDRTYTTVAHLKKLKRWEDAATPAIIM